MAKYHIAITGLNAADNPCPGISVIRSLKAEGREDVRIIGLTYELLCSTSYVNDLVDEVYHVPFPQEDEEKFLSRISEILQKTRIDILLPNLDFEIPVFSRLESDLRDLGLKLLIPSESALTLCAKENLPQLSQLTEIPVPYSLILRDRRQMTTTASYFTYPLVVKAAHGEACLVYSLEEVIVFCNRLASVWGWPLIMQQYIHGDEYCVASLADRRQMIIGSVCMKKIRKSKNGTAWMGGTAKDDTLMEFTQEIIDKLKWIGPLEIEFIKEQNSNRYYLVEINPRFPSWIELAAKVGCNLPMACVKVALREKIPPFSDYKTGILFARSAMDITCDITRLGQLATKKELIYYEDKR